MRKELFRTYVLFLLERTYTAKKRGHKRAQSKMDETEVDKTPSSLVPFTRFAAGFITAFLAEG